MKSERREKILQLIEEHEIETQDELTALLKDAGFDSTQGTVSRDIRSLNITKVKAESGKLIYAAAQSEKTEKLQKMLRVFANGVVSMARSSNIIVVKTLEGMAMAVAASIDTLGGDGILGTIAGDDTVFCVIAETQRGQDIITGFEKLIKSITQGERHD
ncbi:MAG: arginine repressor [Clostridiales bacterium]|nr:arginine repressor [Clostridiales bacterium]